MMLPPHVPKENPWERDVIQNAYLQQIVIKLLPLNPNP